jgi:hypothetical protein
MRDAMRKLLKALLRLASWPLALLILFEEWGWEPLHAALVRLSAWLGLRGIEERIRKLPPYAALALFIVPSLMLVPVKLAALGLIAHGHAFGGLFVIVFAKLAGTAVVARLFALTQPALMRLAWFARAYGRWAAYKESLLAHVRASWPWRAGRVIKRRLRRRWEGWTHG